MKKSCFRLHAPSYAVVGLGFGDEGKGVATNSLASTLPDPVVVRYSGGQQAGHTVTMPDGRSHVFSNFGSGTFQNKPTYWSEYCTFDPYGTLNELEILLKKNTNPILFINDKCPITTHYDKFQNQGCRTQLKNGTCGVGVGATFQREQDFYSLLVGDLLYPSVVEEKLRLIRHYYNKRHGIGITEVQGDQLDQDFLRFSKLLLQQSQNIRILPEMPRFFGSYIFEGSQGLLLDQNAGFFPHVTRSNTGFKNILAMGFEPIPVLMTRAFQTRHGNGPMTNVGKTSHIIDNPKETNVQGKYQGEFRKSMLDLDLIGYAKSREPYLRETTHVQHVVVTCLDLVNQYCYSKNREIYTAKTADEFCRVIGDVFHNSKVHGVSSPSAVIKEIASENS